MNVLGVQMDIAWEDRAANYARARELVEAAKPAPNSLVVLPEMFATGFSMNVAATAEDPERSETAAFLSALARDTACTILGGLVTRAGDGRRGRNEAALFGPDGAEVARYCKRQPFTPGGEKDHYEAGPPEPVVGCVGDGWRVSPLICYDLRFPEAFRPAAGRGVDLFVVIASWPAPRIHHWVALLTARAIENQAYVVGVNRCGTDPFHTYPGRSIIVGPGGEVLADAGDGEGVITATLDRSALADYRQTLPFLADIRPDLVMPARSLLP